MSHGNSSWAITKQFMMQACNTEDLIDIGWVIYLKLVSSHRHNDQKRGEDQSLGNEYKTTFI